MFNSKKYVMLKDQQSLTELQNIRSVEEYTLSEIEVHYRANIKHRTSKICCSMDSYNVLMKVYKDELLDLREEFKVIYLNRSNIINGICYHSIGTTTQTVVDNKTIIGAAIISNSSGIIVSHNHPSGSVIPSEMDKRLTSKLIEAAKLFDIQVLDHIIVSRDQYYSFADDGKI